MPVASMTLAMFSRWRIVMKSCEAEDRPQRDRRASRPSRTPSRSPRRRSTAGRSSSASRARSPTVKSKRDDRVHRDDQRRRQAGQEQVGRPVALPVPRRAPPAHRQEAVDVPRPAVLRPVAQGRQVGDQADVPEQQRDRARRSRRRRRPRPAGCATAARAPSCWDTAAASRRPRAGPGAAAGTARRRPRRTASSPRRTG